MKTMSLANVSPYKWCKKWDRVSKSKESRNTIKLVHDYLKESCGFQTDSLYCSIEDKVFLSVDEAREKLCEVTWNSGNPTPNIINGFLPSKTFLALTQQEDMKGIINPIDCRVYKKDPLASLKRMQEIRGLSIDEKSMKICLMQLYSTVLKHKIIEFKDLIVCEIMEDGVSITKTSRSSQASGIIIDRILLGNTGVVISGLSGKKKTTQELQSISLRNTINDLDDPYFDCFSNVLPLKDIPAYKKSIYVLSLHWHAIMEILIKRVDIADGQIPEANLGYSINECIKINQN